MTKNSTTHSLFTHLSVSTLVNMTLDLDEGLQIQRGREEINPTFHEAREFRDQLLDYLFTRKITFTRDLSTTHGPLIATYNYPPTEG